MKTIDNEFWQVKPVSLTGRTGFWVLMATLRDKTKLNEMCESGNTPWIIWNK